MLAPTEDDFEISPLNKSDAAALSVFLNAQPEEYIRFFTPFDFAPDSILEILLNCEQDIFMGIFWRDELIGFFMLRGWDEGYDIPAYGVLIDERFKGHGLATISLRMSKIIGKLSGAPGIMLKVAPDNVRARKLFERSGFVQTQIDETSSRLIYHFDLHGGSKKF